mmetsp:Transcript_29805/g.79234  ORF Transcript_29805/g.79234 Transcript_29805/m.79234 type:complete len:518 (-) Transcript_29805:94-1647(-)
MMLHSAALEIGSNSRDLTAKVQQVREVLPWSSDDQCCQALVDADEDVMRAIELLLTLPKKSKSKTRREESHGSGAGVPTEAAPASSELESEQLAPADGQVEPSLEVQPTGQEPPVKQRDRPPTALEKELMKMRKKLREITKIEDRLSAGEKVDPLQLPKLERKGEVAAEVARLENQVFEAEQAQLREQEREELERQRVEAERAQERLTQARMAQSMAAQMAQAQMAQAQMMVRAQMAPVQHSQLAQQMQLQQVMAMGQGHMPPGQQLHLHGRPETPHGMGLGQMMHGHGLAPPSPQGHQMALAQQQLAQMAQAQLAQQARMAQQAQLAQLQAQQVQAHEAQLAQQRQQAQQQAQQHAQQQAEQAQQARQAQLVQQVQDGRAFDSSRNAVTMRAPEGDACHAEGGVHLQAHSNVAPAPTSPSGYQDALPLGGHVDSVDNVADQGVRTGSIRGKKGGGGRGEGFGGRGEKGDSAGDRGDRLGRGKGRGGEKGSGRGVREQRQQSQAAAPTNMSSGRLNW